MRNSTFKRAVSLTLASIMGLAPFQTLAQTSEPEYANTKALTEDLAGLLDRAMYPKIPRSGPTGAPTSGDLARAQIRLTELRTRLQAGYLERLLVLDETLDEATKKKDIGTEADPVRLFFLEVDNFYQAAARYESLKLQLGQVPDPAGWDAYYELRYDIDLLSQPRFLDLVALFGEGSAVLPVGGYDRDNLLEAFKKGASFRSHLERGSNGKWTLTFRLDPRFIVDAERLVFTAKPELKSGLQYAAHYAMHALYDSLVITRELRRQTPDTLPEPPAAARQRYVSLRMARERAQKNFQRSIYAEQKPAIYGAIVDAAMSAEKQPATRTFNQGFWDEYQQLVGKTLEAPTAEKLKEQNEQGFDGFSRTVAALINLVDVERQPDLAEFILVQAKRISLRSQFLSNQAISLEYTPEQFAAVAALIDRKAVEYARGVLACTTINDKLKLMQSIGARDMLAAKRLDFQKRLQIASIKLRDFAKDEINLGYLMSAQAEEIKALKPGPLVSTMLEAVRKAGSYEDGYNTYTSQLYRYLSFFKIPKGTGVSIEDLGSVARDLVFDSSKVKDVPPEYMELIDPKVNKGWVESAVDWLQPSWLKTGARVVTPETIHPRNRDLINMIAIGKLLKFNVYQKIPGQRPTVDSLKLDDTYLGKVLRSERRAYLDQFERDVINSSPLLGGLVLLPSAPDAPGETTPLYKLLANPNISAKQKFFLVERQLEQVENSIHRSEQELEGEIAKVDALPANATPENVGSLGKDMLLVATKASRIRLSLETFAAFESFYTEMRRELEMPGFIRQRWEQFTTFADSVANYMMFYLLAQVTLSRFRLVGQLDAVAGKVLAPIFGPSFSRLQPFIWGLLGISMTDQAVRGFGTEVARTESLRKYFECGSAAPCVALYSDMADQTERMNEPRLQMLKTMGTIVAIIGTFRLIRATWSLASRPFKTTFDQVRRDMSTLGIPEGHPLDRDSLRAATASALEKVRMNPDPIAREIGEATVRQTYHRMESRLLKEAMRFVELEERYRPDLIRLNMYGKNWKTPEALKIAFEDVEARYKAGQLLRSEYDSLRSSLVNVQQALAPSWDLMTRDMVHFTFYESVYGLSSRAGGAQLRGYLSARSNFNDGFLRIVDKYYLGGRKFFSFKDGRISMLNRRYDTDRLDKMLNAVAEEVRTAPTLSSERIEQLRAYLKGEKP